MPADKFRPLEEFLRGCDHLIAFLRSIPPGTPNQQEFLGWLNEIKGQAPIDLPWAQKRLVDLESRLRDAPDGAGGLIFSAERYKKYLDDKEKSEGKE